MPWIVVTDTETGAKHNQLVDTVDLAKALTASKVSEGKGPFWRGRVVAGARFSVEGETFDVEFYQDAPGPAQTKRVASAANRPYRGNAERAWEAEDEQAWYRLRHGR